jgi:hypothetical protein
LLSKPAIDLLGEINQSASHVNGVGNPRFKSPEALGQPLELTLSPRADLGKRRRRDDSPALSHYGLKQWFAGLIVAFDGEDVARHAAICPVTALRLAG